MDSTTENVVLWAFLRALVLFTKFFLLFDLICSKLWWEERDGDKIESVNWQNRKSILDGCGGINVSLLDEMDAIMKWSRVELPDIWNIC